MKFKQYEKWEIIEIYWVDSMRVAGWKHEDDLTESVKDNYMDHKTVGYFVKQTDIQIIVATSKSDDGEEKSNVCDVMCIPKVAIKDIKQL